MTSSASFIFCRGNGQTQNAGGASVSVQVQRLEKSSCMGSLFFPYSGLQIAEAHHSHQEGKAALLSLPIQLMISSRNTQNSV